MLPGLFSVNNHAEGNAPLMGSFDDLMQFEDLVEHLGKKLPAGRRVIASVRCSNISFKNGKAWRCLLCAPHLHSLRPSFSSMGVRTSVRIGLSN